MRDFEVFINEIVPERRGTCYLAQNILSSLSKEGSYQDVYRALKMQGTNI